MGIDIAYKGWYTMYGLYRFGKKVTNVSTNYLTVDYKPPPCNSWFHTESDSIKGLGRRSIRLPFLLRAYMGISNRYVCRIRSVMYVYVHSLAYPTTVAAIYAHLCSQNGAIAAEECAWLCQSAPIYVVARLTKAMVLMSCTSMYYLSTVVAIYDHLFSKKGLTMIV